MHDISKKLCEKIWYEYETQLEKICRIRLRGLESEVDDVISEVFTALCVKFERDGAPENAKAWLYATLNNTISQKIRDVCKVRENISSVPLDEIDLRFTNSISTSAFKSVSADEFCKVVKSIITEEDYQLIEDLYINDIKPSEIAERLGLSENAVRQRGYRICAKLRTKLADYADLSELL